MNISNEVLKIWVVDSGGEYIYFETMNEILRIRCSGYSDNEIYFLSDSYSIQGITFFLDGIDELRIKVSTVCAFSNSVNTLEAKVLNVEYQSEDKVNIKTHLFDFSIHKNDDDF